VVVRAPAVQSRPLFERDAERARLVRALGEARQGRPSLVFVEGPPGAGKTSLLDEACAAARDADVRLLHARGSEFEREFPFGIVRQLFEAVATRSSRDERAELFTGAAELARPVLEGSVLAQPALVADPFPALHGLYWLTVNVATRGPVAVVVDDVHWADESSLRWVHYLVRRMEGLGLLVLVAARTHEPGARHRLLEAVRAEPHAEVLVPPPLSVGGVGELVRLALGAPPDAAFSQACLHATGGNPLLLTELLLALGDDGVVPTAAQAARVAAYGPEPTSRGVLVRLARLPAEATLVAQTLSVLGPGAHLGQLCAVAGIDRDAAARAVDLLGEAQVLVGGGTLEFVHPVVRAAIYAQLGPAARSSCHERAARLCAAAGAPPEEVAGHLLAVEASGNAWVVERLREAATRAATRGAPEAAVALLRRAMAEPPSPPERPWVLVELARARTTTADADGFGAFAEAYSAVEHAPMRAKIALEWGQAVQMTGATTEASGVFERGIATLGGEDPVLTRILEGQRLAAMLADCATSREATESLRAQRDAVAREPRPEPMLLAACADAAAYVGEAISEAIDLARRALASVLDRPGPEALSVAIYAAHTLRCAGLLDEAGAVWDAVIAQTQRLGAILPFAAAACFRGEVSGFRGALGEAEADLRRSLDISLEHGFDVGRMWITAHLVEVLVEQGELEAAMEIAEQIGFDDRAPTRLASNTLLCARGRARYEQGRPADALADLKTCGRYANEGGITNPAVLPWRSRAALVHLRLGDAETARTLALDELKDARAWGAPRSLGVALRAAARVSTAGEPIELLREATAVLESTPARIEQAHAACDLGAALRRAGHRHDARDPLRRALDAAVTCGARPLAQRARQELTAAGARPRRDRIEGRQALTASELRVASLAAEGRTNREIAQSLFVTLKTVETHLRHAFGKLGISGRQELVAALEQRRTNGPTAP
jgi:DNA-binding CsgD family transcriptional regulator/tetratricopeptide (TPR) repeat protein